MKVKLPTIIVTGASGIVGKSFLEFSKKNFKIYAIARRSQTEVLVEEHPNIKWIQVDIGNRTNLNQVLNFNIKEPIDFVLHLAGYYDFDNTDNEEYTRTNVYGTRYVLEYSARIKVRRFVFASSVAATKFPGPNETLNEKSPLNATYPYARSKKIGEDIVEEFSKTIPCSVVRFAAVFSDWCEYGPLYIFLKTWLSNKWNSRVVGGKGESAIPYIHVSCLCHILITIFLKTDRLKQFDVYIASPDGSISHKELYGNSTRYYFGKRIKPVLMPRALATMGVIVYNLIGSIIGKRPFERLWMMKYIDKKLNIDSSYTRKELNWSPTPHFMILRRLLYIIETMKSNPFLFHIKNATALRKSSQRDNYIIYEVMVRKKDEIKQKIKNVLLNPKHAVDFAHYQKINIENLNWDVSVFYQLLTASVRNHDRLILLNYLRNILVPIRVKEGFESHEVCNALLDSGKIVISMLLKEPDLQGMEQIVYDNIAMTIQLSVDEVENVFEELSDKPYIVHAPHRADVETKLNELATFYDDIVEEMKFNT